MIVFRHPRTETTLAQLWNQARRAEAAVAGQRFDALWSAARLEAAVADFCFADADDRTPASEALVRLSCRAAGFYLTGRWLSPCPDWSWLQTQLPPLSTMVNASDPEGLRFYALSPAAYAAAAREWQRRAPEGQPAWVLGLRSMGSVLAPVAWAALRPTRLPHRCATLRPRGHPFRRRIRASARLAAEISAWPGDFLIADEGPGLSGSSFAGTVRFLLNLGCDRRRIWLLASWNPDAAAVARLRSRDAAAHWRQWQVLSAPALAPPASDGEEAIPIGGGEWRRWFPGRGRAPAWGQHERLKFLSDFRAGRSQTPRSLVKFAGFGVYGRRTRSLAEELARAGWGPPVREVTAAFTLGTGNAAYGAAGAWVRFAIVAARPLPTRPDRKWAEWAGRYLAWRRSALALGAAVPPAASLREMLESNLDELCGRGVPWEPPQGVPVAIDGRMLRHEWGQTGRGWIKFDSTDHGDDQFFPGPADIAWDLAGLEAEFPAVAAAAIAAYRRHSGETEAQLESRLRWYRLAYGAFHAAYCSLAAEETDGFDQLRFQSESRRYRRFCTAATRWAVGGQAGVRTSGEPFAGYWPESAPAGMGCDELSSSTLLPAGGCSSNVSGAVKG